MSSSIYNHRNLQPTVPPQSAPPPATPARLAECLDTIRHEFEAVMHDSALLKSQREEYQTKLDTQVAELDSIRNALYALESAHASARQGYEDELARMRVEVQQARAQAAAPPDRERERERDRERGDREPKRVKTEPQQSQQPLPPQQQRKDPPPKPPGEAAPAVPPPYPEELELDSVAPEHKKQGDDWVAVFNPRVPRALDISLLHTLQHESVVCCVRFSHDGQFLATGCNHTAQIFDIKTGAVTVLNDEKASKTGDVFIRSVCFSPDGKLLATGAEDKTIRIWDIAKRKVRSVLEGHAQEIYALDFARDGRFIVSGSGDRTARIWDMDSARCRVLRIDEPDGTDAGVTSVAVSPDGALVAAGSLDTVVRIWEVASGALVERLSGHRDSVYAVAFTPDGTGLVSGSLDKTLKLWNIAPLLRPADRAPLQQGGSTPSSTRRDGGERGSVCVMDYKGHRDYVLSVAVSHTGEWVVSGSKDRGVQFWDAHSAAVQLTLQGHKNSVISIDLSPVSGLLATGSGDANARVWKYTTSRERERERERERGERERERERERAP